MSSKTRRASVAKSRKGRSVTRIAIIVALAVAALAGIYFVSAPTAASVGAGAAGQYPFEVGTPGPGAEAPPFVLPSTKGGAFNLADMRGETVLLYFQEGAMCQACWDQLKDIERQWSAFEAAGIDRIVTITTDPPRVLAQKVRNERLTTPALSDPDLSVSRRYTTNEYGMMGGTTNGHTFILVDPEGVIRWRADYGGAPDYTMYVPVPNLLADLEQGVQEVANAN